MSWLGERQISYISKRKTGYWIAKNTGIPSSTVYRFLRGVGEIPKKYAAGIRAPYQRITYAGMRETGFSSYQARRFAWYSPETVNRVIGGLQDKIKDLARGLAIKQLEKWKLPPLEDWVQSVIPGMAKKVIEGMKKSKAAYEEWIEY